MKTPDRRGLGRREKTPVTLDQHERRVKLEQQDDKDRRSLRVIKRLPVHITIDHPKLKEKGITAVSRDLGEGGVFLEVGDHEHHEEVLTHLLAPENYKLNVGVHLQGKKIQMKAVAEVVNVTPLSQPSGKKFGISLRFVDVSLNKKEELSLYLNQLAAKNELPSSEEKESFTFCKTLYMGDTNAFGDAYFARYFDWQGMAREEFLKRLLPDPIQAIRSGMKLVTVEAQMRYRKAATLYDEIEITVSTEDIKKASFDLIFIFRDKKTWGLIGKGRQKIAILNANGRAVPIPHTMRLNTLKYLTNTPKTLRHDGWISHGVKE
jgi:acyl-CoA thioesterase FadM